MVEKDLEGAARLRQHIERGELEEIRRCLMGRHSLNTLSKSLVDAITIGPKEAAAHIVQLLLLAGADPNTRRDDLERNPVIKLAASYQLPDVVDCLILAKADVNATDSNGKNSLFSAVMQRDKSMIQRLLDYGADPLSGKSEVGQRLATPISAAQMFPETREDGTLALLIEAQSKNSNSAGVVRLVNEDGASINKDDIGGKSR